MSTCPHASKLLIIEDDIRLHHFLQKVFSLTNRITISVYHLEDALSILQQECLAVVVLDLDMLARNKWGCIDLLRATFPPEARPQIILITGCDPLELRDASLNQHWVLQKPLNLSHLTRLAIQVRHRRTF